MNRIDQSPETVKPAALVATARRHDGGRWSLQIRHADGVLIEDYSNVIPVQEFRDVELLALQSTIASLGYYVSDTRTESADSGEWLIRPVPEVPAPTWADGPWDWDSLADRAGIYGTVQHHVGQVGQHSVDIVYGAVAGPDGTVTYPDAPEITITGELNSADPETAEALAALLVEAARVVREISR